MDLKEKQISELKSYVQKIMRAVPASPSQTPCGMKISTSCAHVLLALFHTNDEDVNQQLLAKELSLNKSSIARICTDLEEKGFIIIKTNSSDKRNNVISLTSKGRKFSERLKSQGDQYFEKILDRIPKNKISDLLSSLKILTESLQQDEN